MGDPPYVAGLKEAVITLHARVCVGDGGQKKEGVVGMFALVAADV